jgi:hypothetical protein
MPIVSIGVVIFSVAFVVVGVLRVVEFTDLGLRNRIKIPLIAAHLVGCVLFALSLVLLGVDVRHAYGKLMGYLLLPSLALLLPVHIFIALKRRIKAQGKIPKP